jgi:hypothetical protein
MKKEEKEAFQEFWTDYYGTYLDEEAIKHGLLCLKKSGFVYKA